MLTLPPKRMALEKAVSRAAGQKRWLACPTTR